MSAIVKIEASSDAEKARAALEPPLGFGTTLADLMVRMEHGAERGWRQPIVTATAPLELSPAAKALHYGVEVFEGMKAYGWADGRVALFRPELNARRLNASARRIRMPEIAEETQLAAIEALVGELRAWVPRGRGSALYLRPAIIGTEAALRVSSGSEHLYFVIASPVGPYFSGGFKAIPIMVEESQVRAAVGGVGEAKTGGNYAAGLDGQERAREMGFEQVLWLDAREHRYLEELNGMNVFVVDRGSLLTPPLDGTILPGIVRRSILELAPDLGLTASEHPLAIEDVMRGIESGRVTEILAVGTGAIITPVGSLGYRGRTVTVGDGEPGPVAKLFYDAVAAIQHGESPDPRGWMRVVG